MMMACNSILSVCSSITLLHAAHLPPLTCVNNAMTDMLKVLCCIHQAYTQTHIYPFCVHVEQVNHICISARTLTLDLGQNVDQLITYAVRSNPCEELVEVLDVFHLTSCCQQVICEATSKSVAFVRQVIKGLNRDQCIQREAMLWDMGAQTMYPAYTKCSVSLLNFSMLPVNNIADE